MDLLFLFITVLQNLRMRNNRFTEGINNFWLLLPGKYAKDIDTVVFNNE